MRRSFTLSALLAFAPLALPGLALPGLALGQPLPPGQPLSQDLQLVTLHHSAHSGIATPRTAVIDDMAALRAFFAGTSVDLGPQPRVDFSTEQVLVAAMGTQPTGGYGIEITRVTLMNGGFTGGRAFVEVSERRPAPGQFVTMALTSPIHVVRVPRGAIAYHFTTVQGPGFESLELLLEHPLTHSSERLVLGADGAAQLLRASPTARYAPLNGFASAAELRAVSAAFAQADVASLPGSIPDPRVFIVAPDTVTISSTLPGGQAHATSANLGWYTPYEARFQPLMAALQAIADRLLATPQLDALTFDWSGGFSLYDEAVTIGADGSVVVNRTGRLTSYHSGRAEPAQLQALLDAVAAADLASLPTTIDDPLQVTDVPGLTIVASFGGSDVTINVAEAGLYDVYTPRLQPVEDAVRAIADHVVATGQLVVTGEVQIDAARRLFVGAHRVYWSAPLAQLIAAQVGKTIRATGTTASSATGPRLHVESITGAAARAPLFLRSQPRWSAGLLTVLPRGSEVEVLRASNGWLLVRSGQQTGWAASGYVQLAR